MDCTAFIKEITCSVIHVKESGEKVVFILLLFENYLKAIEGYFFLRKQQTVFSRMNTSHLN